MGGGILSEPSPPTLATHRQDTDSGLWKSLDVQAVKKKRTDQERKRRKLCGDIGARFSKGREVAIGYDGISNALTTAICKDNLVSEILWI